jgi:hypothetical protein
MTKQNIETNLSNNNWLDKAMMGAAAFVLVALAAKEMLNYISAAHPFNYIMAGAMMTLILYALLSPIYRK